MKVAILDIETSPDWSRIDRFKDEPKAQPELQPFNPDAVKTGNLKDPAKIQAKIEEAEANHIVNWEAECEKVKQENLDAEAKLITDSTLNGWQSRIYGFGFKLPHGEIEVFQRDPMAMTDDDERELVREIVRRVEPETPQGIIAGWNFGFDIDHIVQRAAILGVPVFEYAKPLHRNAWFCDLMLCAAPSGQKRGNSLDIVAKGMDLVGKLDLGKNEDGTKRLPWQAAAEDFALGEEYLRRDIEIEAAIAERLS